MVWITLLILSLTPHESEFHFAVYFIYFFIIKEGKLSDIQVLCLLDSVMSSVSKLNWTLLYLKYATKYN